MNRLDLAEIVEPLSDAERWLLVKECLRQKPSNALHFLHIPKTGGTSFGETLGQDKKAVIISVDALPETLAGQLLRFSNTDEKMLVITRAHHSLKVIENSGCLEHISLVLTAYRNPAEVHVSNVNMIMRRVSNYIDGQGMLKAERIFCKEWLENFPMKFSNTKEFAKCLLRSDVYRDRMGKVYSLFLLGSCWKKMIKSKELFVISSDSFDDLFVDVFDYAVLPTRKNVSVSPMLTLEDFDAKCLSGLVAGDEALAEFLKDSIVKPAQIRDVILSGNKQ
ncbi:hypothetical protein [Aestuariirhabdus sp. LZHN29]|uniref:hypothetical protein n=1 Tax=Aestuariirhabdus sp. LZHN29 TaxID=3417462 RepID=UPI003CF3BC7A